MAILASKIKVILIGAGQLGSRHLQSIKSVAAVEEIWIVDPSLESLTIAKERYESIKSASEIKVRFETSLPTDCDFDFAIIATGSAVRAKVTKDLVEKNNVRFILFEKILFSKEAEYDVTEKLLESKSIKSWVNCTMRQMPIYRNIKTDVKQSPFNLTVTGSKFGLMTNAIHYLDYACWLAESTDFVLDTTSLNKDPIPSKRNGYFEYEGTLLARFQNGSTVNITCFSEGQLPVLVEVHAPFARFVVRESESITNQWTTKNGNAMTDVESKIPFQSQLTSLVIESVLSTGTCVLTEFSEAKKIHLNFLRPFASKLKQQNQMDYPFT